MAKNQKLEVSILAFDTSSENIFNKQLEKMQKNEIEIVHYDVMDGVFVPNRAYGTEYLSTLYLYGFDTHVHFMVTNPWKWTKEFLHYPLNAITFHPEPISKLQTRLLIRKIQKSGKKAGLAFRPQTDINQYKNILKKADIVTIMGVNPGFGGQKFMEEITLKNLKLIKTIKDELNPSLIIQLDGGVNYDVIKLTHKYVDNFISGSFLVKQPEPIKVKEFIEQI